MIDNILHLVAEFYEIDKEPMVYGTRERRYSEPRHVAMYCLYHIVKMSYPAITKLFGKKSHRTTMYAVEKVREWKYNPKLNKKAADCIQHVVQNLNSKSKKICEYRLIDKLKDGRGKETKADDV